MCMFLKPPAVERLVGSMFTNFRYIQPSVFPHLWEVASKLQMKTKRNSCLYQVGLGEFETFRFAKSDFNTDCMVVYLWNFTKWSTLLYIQTITWKISCIVHLVVYSRQLADDRKKLGCTKLCVDQSNRWDLYSTCWITYKYSTPVFIGTVMIYGINTYMQ